jgi:hypothetical protein
MLTDLTLSRSDANRELRYLARFALVGAGGAVLDFTMGASATGADCDRYPRSAAIGCAGSSGGRNLVARGHRLGCTLCCAGNHDFDRSLLVGFSVFLGLFTTLFVNWIFIA